MPLKEKTFLNHVKDYALLVLGLLLYVLGWTVFLVPNNLVGGGVTGVASIIQYATHGFIKIGYTYFTVNIILLVIALFTLGKGFGSKTVVAIILASLGLNLFQTLIPAEICQTLAVENGKLMSVIMGGILVGVGIGLTMSAGGSTGGTDIIALIVNKYWPISLSGIFFIMDFVVVISQLLLRPGFGSYAGEAKTFNDVMYGIIEIVTFALTIDLFTVGGKAKMQLFIFSEKYQQIADYVCDTMERGVTLLHSMGWYTKKEKNVLLILLTRQEVSKLSKVINEIDPKAFMSIGGATEVYGEGFTEIKAGKLKLNANKKSD